MIGMVSMEDLFFEDVVVGQEFVSATHTVAASDINAFADITRDHHALHVNEEHARKMGFPGVIAHGLFGVSLMEGLKSELRLYEHTSIASLGWDRVRFRRPVAAGDTLRLRIRFQEKRLSQKAGRGIVIEMLQLYNQKGEVVTEAEHSSLLRCRVASGEE
jgi:acyl dehydratase